ncbi:glycosyltransferase family 2 protein [Pseudoalteromonas xiamenensis]
MKVSIITVCYNSAATIEDTLKSVVAQTYDNIEYIIVDGGSKDETLAIVEKYKEHVDVLISEPDHGIYDAMNKGIEVATGDVVGILNSDDFYETPDVITTVVKSFDSSIDLLFGDLVFIKPQNLKKVTRFYSLPKFKGWHLRFGWMPPHPATFIRKEVYNRFGLYKTHYKISADYELFVRLFLVNKLKFRHIDKILVRMRDGGVSTSGIRSSLSLNTEIVQACTENNVYTNLLFVLSKIPFKLFELFKRPKNER